MDYVYIVMRHVSYHPGWTKDEPFETKDIMRVFTNRASATAFIEKYAEKYVGLGNEASVDFEWKYGYYVSDPVDKKRANDPCDVISYWIESMPVSN